MFPSTADMMRLAPEIVLCAMGILIMVAEPFAGRAGRKVLDVLAVLGAAGALAAIWLPAHNIGTAFSNLLRVDAFSVFVHAIVGAVALLVILAAPSYLDRKSTRLNSSHLVISYAVFCLKKKKTKQQQHVTTQRASRM